MIDIHTHILPGIDDGAKDSKESISLIKILSLQNISHIILTPHYYPFEIPLEVFCEKRKKSFEELSTALQTENISPELKLAAEVQYNSILFNNDTLSELCIEGTSYMLLELPYADRFEENMLDKLSLFIDVYGITPIIAHVERYGAVQRDISLVAKMKDAGCLVQVNCDSIIDRGRENRTAKKLFKNGLCDLLGSDCHNTKLRPPNIDSALKQLEKKFGDDITDWLRENAECVFAGQPLLN